MISPSGNPSGWRGDPRLWRETISFADHWRRRRHTGPVGFGPSDAALLASIDLEGMRVSLVIGPSGGPDPMYCGKAIDKSEVVPALGVINLSSMLTAYGARVVTRDFFVSDLFTQEERAVLSDLARIRARLDGHPDPAIDALVGRWGDRILDDSPAVIGLSARVEADPWAFLLLLRLLRSRQRTVPLVLGGVWPAAGMSAAMLAEFDFTVRGEGDVPFLLICSSIARGWDPSRIPGIPRAALDGRREGHSGNPFVECGSEVIHALDALPAPSLAGLDLSSYTYELYTGWRGVTIPYRFVVGCPFNCAYCNLQFKRRYMIRAVPLVLRDLESLHGDFGIEQFLFLNSAFNVDVRHSEQLVEGMIATGRSWRWSDCARPRRLTPLLLSRMRKAGCEWLNWGLDTASDRLDALYRRGMPRRSFAELMSQAKRAGIRNAVNVIVGMPNETEADVDELLRFIDDNRAVLDHVFVYKYHFIPHSDIGVNPSRYGLRVTEDSSGVDEVGGFTWEQRQEWCRRIVPRVKEVASETNILHGTQN